MKCLRESKTQADTQGLVPQDTVYWGHDSSTGMTGIVPKIATSTGPLTGLEGYSAPTPTPYTKINSPAYGPAEAGRAVLYQP